MRQLKQKLVPHKLKGHKTEVACNLAGARSQKATETFIYWCSKLVSCSFLPLRRNNAFRAFLQRFGLLFKNTNTVNCSRKGKQTTPPEKANQMLFWVLISIGKSSGITNNKHSLSLKNPELHEHDWSNFNVFIKNTGKSKETQRRIPGKGEKKSVIYVKNSLFED